MICNQALGLESRFATFYKTFYNIPMNSFLFSSWCVLIVYVLLETSAVPKWAELLKLKCLKYEEYNEFAKIGGAEMKYKFFLLTKYNNFFVSLFTCQECLLIWMNIIGTLILMDKIGGWQFFGFNCLLTLLELAAFKFLLKKFYR